MAQPNDEVNDRELLERLAESAMSMIMPPPESGREQFVISLRIDLAARP